MNRFKYSAFGREANRTLRILKVPKEIPNWVYDLNPNLEYTKEPLCRKDIQLNDRKWKFFVYQDLFDIERGRGAREFDVTGNGITLFITSTDSNNGLIGRVNRNPCHQGNVITVARNGSIAQTFYQPEAFCSTEDVHVFNPKFSLNSYIAMFLIPIIKKEGYKYSYARKWGLERMRISKMFLPADEKEEPDWHFMEDYIKSLPYSKYIVQMNKALKFEKLTSSLGQMTYQQLEKEIEKQLVGSMKDEQYLELGFALMFSGLILVLIALALFNRNLTFDQVIALLIVGSTISIMGVIIMLRRRRRYPFRRTMFNSHHK